MTHLPTMNPEPHPKAMAFNNTQSSVGHGLSDEVREAAIKRAGAAMQKHYAEWVASGCFAAKGSADRAMQLMYRLIKGRSQAQIARMQQERGLA